MTEITTAAGTAEVAPAAAQREFQKGRGEFKGAVQLVRGDEAGEVDSGDLPTALAQGWRVADAGMQKTAKLRAEEGGLAGNIRGGAEAAARGFTLGGSDVALRALGADTERMAARKQQLGGGAALLEVAGGALGGGAGIGKGIAKVGQKALGTSALARVATGTGAGAIEGALQGAGAAASELALGDRDLAAEQLLAGAKSGAGLGALFGAGATTLGLGLERAYLGGQRVSKDLMGRAVGAGDDAASAAGQASARGDSFMHGAAKRQVELLGGTADHVAAAHRSLNRTRTAAGRKLGDLARGPAGAVDDAVGARLRTSVGNAGAGKAVRSWGSKLKATSAGKKHLGRQAGEGAEALRGVQGKNPTKIRQLLRAESRGIVDAKSYQTGRARIEKRLADMRANQEPGLEAAEAATKAYRDAGRDPMIWGDGVAAREAVTAGQQAEKAALASLSPKVRKAMTGNPIDDATARAMGKEGEGIEAVLAARTKVADALDGVGEDVSALRKGLDEVREGLDYRGKVAAAKDDLGLLDGLEQGAGGTAREALKYAGRGAGAILGGLTFGGAALGELTGAVVGAATRPASAIRLIARARGGIDAVANRQGAAVKAFASVVDGTAAAARKAAPRARTAARRVAPAVARRKQQARTDEIMATMRRVATLASDPEKLADEMGEATRALRVAAPDVSGAVVAGAARAAAYLKAVAPPVYKPRFGGDVEMVDPFELSAFGRRLEAVQDPMATMDRLAKGSMTKEHAEALQAVYPRMYEDLQERIMETVGARSASDNPVSFQARTSLGLLGGVITDDTLRPADYAQIQSSMVSAPPAPAGSPPPPSSVDPPPVSKWQRMEGGS